MAYATRRAGGAAVAGSDDGLTRTGVLFAGAVMAGMIFASGVLLVLRVHDVRAGIPREAHHLLLLGGGESRPAKLPAGTRFVAAHATAEWLARSPRAAFGPSLAVAEVATPLDGLPVAEVEEQLRELAGVLEVVEAAGADRVHFTPARMRSYASGALLLFLAGSLGLGLSFAGVLRAELERHRVALVRLHLRGVSRGRAGADLPRRLAALVAAGVASGSALALAVVALVFGAAAVSPSAGAAAASAVALGAAPLLAWLAAWLAACAQARRFWRRAVQGVLSGLLLLLVPGLSAAEETRARPVAVQEELRQLSRELAVSRRARLLATRALLESERLVFRVSVVGDAERRALALAQRDLDRDHLRHWETRCLALRQARQDLRDQRRAWRQVEGSIHPRRLPAAGGVAVPFSASTEVPGFEGGIGLRVGAQGWVRAAAPGRVVFAGQLPGRGGVVVLGHGRRVFTIYGRLGSFLVAAGEDVGVGAPLARPQAGGDGVIYFSVRRRRQALDPQPWQAQTPVSHAALR